MSIKVDAQAEDVSGIINPVLPAADIVSTVIYGEPADPTRSESTVDDRVIASTTGSFASPERVDLSGVPDGGILESLSPGYMTADQANNRFAVANDPPPGTVLSGIVRTFGYKPSRVNAAVETPSQNDRVASLVAGTLAGDTTSELRAHMTPGATLPNTSLFSTYSPYSSFVRSSSHWLAASGFDLTGCVVATNAPQIPKGKRGGALITPRIVIWSKHYGGNGPGTSVYFVDSSGTIHSRAIVREVTVTNLDLKLSLLDSDLPGEVSPYPLCPDLSLFMGSGGWGAAVGSPLGGPACVWVDQNEKVYFCGYSGPYAGAYVVDRSFTANGNSHVGQIGYFHHAKDVYGQFQSLVPEEDEDYFHYAKSPISGDSGSPIFLAENGRLVYLSCWWGSNNGMTSEGMKPALDDLIVDLWAAHGLGAPAIGDLTTEAAISGYATFP